VIVYVATKNAGKFAELQAIFAQDHWELRPHPAYDDVAEGEGSYAENAALKARALWQAIARREPPAAVLGDDSGLEVAALGGRPGVRSARYGGPRATWAERRRSLLAELAASGSGDRRARFVCALHFIAPDGAETAVEAALEGFLADADRGSAGFSYDPIFVYPPLGATFGELDDAAKNGVSHRALAARKLVTELGKQRQSADFPAPAGN